MLGLCTGGASGCLLTLFLLDFQPRGRSDTPVYNDNSDFGELRPDVSRNDLAEATLPGRDDGFVVTSCEQAVGQANDIARETVVLVLSRGILECNCETLVTEQQRLRRAGYTGQPLLDAKHGKWGR